MLSPEVLAELKNLKTYEKLDIDDYKITINMLCIGDIIDCADEYKKISTEKDIATILTVGLNLINRTIIVEQNNTKLEFSKLPMPIAINCVEVWLTLNFMKKEQIIKPLERAMEKITGKKVDLMKIFSSFSSLLSNQDIVPEKTS